MLFKKLSGRARSLAYILVAGLFALIAFYGCSQTPQTGFHGQWKVVKMGPANQLRTPRGASITYDFKNNSTLIIKTPYKNAKREFQKKKNQLKFSGQGLFGSFHTFIYTVSKDTLTLKTKRGFVVKFVRAK